jgi:hypothetical protein
MKADDFPKYGIPSRVVAGLAFSTLLGLRRSFREDAIRCVGRLRPPLQVSGKEYVLQSGPCVLTVNHYHRPGFGAQWLALAISACVPYEMHWVMTAEWTVPGKWYEPIKGLYSRTLLKYLSRAYGFTTMPPMPPRPKDIEARAGSVRKVLEYAKRHPDFVLGMAPEGVDQAEGKLSEPAPGAGRFGLLLAGLGSAFVPVGAHEADGALCLRFGPAYQLSVLSGLSTDEKDHIAAEVMMKKIAALLPETLRGEFA